MARTTIEVVSCDRCKKEVNKDELSGMKFCVTYKDEQGDGACTYEDICGPCAFTLKAQWNVINMDKDSRFPDEELRRRAKDKKATSKKKAAPPQKATGAGLDASF